MLFRDKLSRNKHQTLPFRKAYGHLRAKLLWNNVITAYRSTKKEKYL